MNLRFTFKLFLIFSAFGLFFPTITSAQLHTKLQWIAQDSVWGVFVRTDTATNPSQNILLGSGQITVVAPSGFAITNLRSFMGSWDQNARANSPMENPEKDYISFGIELSESISQLGMSDEVLVLTFESPTRECPTSLYLIEHDDPFATNIPNSLNTNPGNDLQMVDLGNSRAIYSYSGNYDLDSWNCSGEENLTTSIDDFQSVQSVKVFPNPFSEEVIFELTEKNYHRNLAVKLSDNLGRLIYQEEMEQDRLRVRVQSESALYFYEIIDLETNQIIETGKLFKQ